ncbi:MAG: helix-turn-helix domain-containing protein [Lysobacteraceae bacterium]
MPSNDDTVDAPGPAPGPVSGRALRSAWDWYTHGPLSDYVVQAHPLHGAGLSVMQALQPAGDMSDPAVDDYVLGTLLSPPTAVDFDFGAGRFRGPVRTGDLWLVPAGSATRIEVSGRHLIRMLFVPRAGLARLDPEGGAPPDHGWIYASLFRDPLVAHLMRRLWEEAAHHDAVTGLYADGCTLAIFRRLREIARGRREDNLAYRGGLAPVALHRAIERIRTEHDRELRLADLAAEAGMTPWHFCRAFKASTGHAPHRFQLEMRIDRAKALLEHGDASMAEIGARVGYAAPQSFSRVFRRHVGVGPARYRRLRGKA